MPITAITGSASGIGAAVSAALRAAGHQVIGIDRSNAEVIADLSTAQGRATGGAGDRFRCGDPFGPRRPTADRSDDRWR